MLKILQLNTRSARNKRLNLEALLSTHKPNIVSICEHWMKDFELNSFALSNYHLCSSFCRPTPHGGVALFVDTALICKPAQLVVSCEEGRFEYAGGQVKYKGRNILVISLYRPPGSDVKQFLERFEILINQACKKFEQIIISGDFNIDLLSDKSDTVKFKNVLHRYGFQQTIYKPTRSSQSLIDNIFINFEMQESEAVSFFVEFSDHDAILLNIPHNNYENKKQSNKQKLRRSFTHEEQLKFCSLLENHDWVSVYNSNGVEQKYSKFIETITSFLQTAFPLKPYKKNNTKNWVTPEIINMSAELKNIHWLYKNTGDDNVRLYYNNLAKAYRHTLKKAKHEYTENRLAHTDNFVKTSWDIINNNISSGRQRKTNLTAITTNGRVIEDTQKIANMLNETFTKVTYTSERAGININSNNMTRKTLKTIFLNPVDNQEVVNLILSVATKKSHGTDGIPCFIIYNSAHLIAKPLAHIINCSFEEGIYPSQLKVARVVPIYKNGDQSDLNNYRPISLLSVFAKVLDRAMYERLIQFINKHNLLSDSHHGFVKDKNTTSALVESMSFIAEALDKGIKPVGIFFDLSKAFDTVNKALLLRKLDIHGISGLALKWFESFLSDRRQYVDLETESGSVQSQTLTLQNGVPQGGILSPLLFLIFSNDLHSNITSVISNEQNFRLCQYADDTTILIKNNKQRLHSTCHTAADAMSNWCDRNGLKLNASKSTVLQFSNNHSKFDECSLLVKCAKKSIPVKNVIKFLGIQVDDKLIWDKHVQFIIKKLNSAHFALLNLRKSVGLKLLIQFYHACIKTHLEYGIILWGRGRDVTSVLILQKKIIRLIKNAPYDAHCRPLFKELHLMTVVSMYSFGVCLFTYDNKENFLTNGGNSSGPHTRNQNELCIPKHSSTLFERNLYYSSIKIYNKLPNEIKLINNRNIFKNKLKAILVEYPYYSVDEYLHSSDFIVNTC
jgi:exonuclease III